MPQRTTRRTPLTPQSNLSPLADRAEELFERFLWSARYLVLVAVISSLLASLALFFVGAYEVVHVLVTLVVYAVGTSETLDVPVAVVGSIVGSVDVFLIAVVLLIFSFGLYELFLSPIDRVASALDSHILNIRSLDVLKDKIGHVILLAMSVKFFQIVLTMKVHDWTDLLVLAGGIALVSAALFLIRWGKAIAHEGD